MSKMSSGPRQPAAGKWEGQFESVGFANKRKNNRNRNKIARAARRRNRQ